MENSEEEMSDGISEGMSFEEYEELIEDLYQQKIEEIMKDAANICMCQECRARFFNYGYMCSDVMNIIIATHFAEVLTLYNDFFEDKGFLSTIKFLERKGYLISTEVESGFCGVRLNDKKYEFDEENLTICWCSSIKKQGRPKKKK